MISTYLSLIRVKVTILITSWAILSINFLKKCKCLSSKYIYLSRKSLLNVIHLLTFQLNILPLIWSRDGPLFFSSFVKGIQFQSQLTVSRYPTSKCQVNIKKGWSMWGAKGFTVNELNISHLEEFPRVHWVLAVLFDRFYSVFSCCNVQNTQIRI